MTLAWWTAGMVATLAMAASPLLRSEAIRTAYPTWLNVAVGAAVVTLAWLAPVGPAGAIPALMALGAVALAPIVVDGLLDHAGAGDTATGGHGAGGGEHFGGAMASTTAGLATSISTCDAF